MRRTMVGRQIQAPSHIVLRLHEVARLQLQARDLEQGGCLARPGFLNGRLQMTYRLARSPESDQGIGGNFVRFPGHRVARDHRAHQLVRFVEAMRPIVKHGQANFRLIFVSGLGRIIAHRPIQTFDFARHIVSRTRVVAVRLQELAHEAQERTIVGRQREHPIGAMFGVGNPAQPRKDPRELYGDP